MVLAVPPLTVMEAVWEVGANDARGTSGAMADSWEAVEAVRDAAEVVDAWHAEASSEACRASYYEVTGQTRFALVARMAPAVGVSVTEETSAGAVG
jgi:hypothetical protein